VLQEIGRKWLQAMEYPVLKVPSAIIPVEYNYLINPEHPDLQLQTEQLLEFQFDRRMWKVQR
jgi:RES domain-containing protein